MSAKIVRKWAPAVVLVKCPVDQQFLEDRSEVFKQQFSGRWKKSTYESPEYLNIEEFSPKAQIAFLSYTYGKVLYFADHAKESATSLELYRLADKYQIAELKTVLEKAISELKVEETEVFIVMDAILNNMDLAPLEEVCRKYLRKCAETVHYEQINVLQLWRKHGNENGKALSMLTAELEKLEGFRCKTTLQFKVGRVSQLQNNDTLTSAPCTMRHLTWSLRVNRNEDTFAFYLMCDNDYSKDWSCSAHVELRMLNEMMEWLTFRTKTNMVFSQAQRGLGFRPYMNWSKVADPTSGYVQDDHFVFEAEIQTDVPEGLFSENKKLIETEVCKNCGTTPCLDGQPVREARVDWGGLKVSRKLVSNLVVRGSRREETKGFSFPFMNRDAPIYLQLEELSTAPVDEVLTFSCK